MQEQEEVKPKYITSAQCSSALITPEQNEEKENEYINELAFLCETAGAYPQKSFPETGLSQSRHLCGPWQLREIADYIKSVDDDPEQRIGLAIFDDELSPKQLQNIERVWA